MKTYQIELPDEFATFVDRAVSEGKWDSAGHLVMYGLMRAMDDVRLDEEVDQDTLRAELQIGIDQLKSGEVAELDMARVWARASR